ncbi:hypothetical protein ACFR9U_16505 [Halorientalis brevis]|uniref:Proteasome lid subunit RPN8/RPN11, contains Jab1/MPN metalloenzyme (JAMM) motif n=1 Tax=Halorientalis brevis TaxID=1126241 RepID=A0ABD6CDZ5_9EURY
MVHITRGLAETLLRFARERDPESVTISLSVRTAAELDGTDLDDDTPVFTHFYLPNAGKSVNAVFGVDLGTPAGQIQGRFVSHPTGDLSVSKRDDLAEVVFVAVPPWERASLAAFDRKGRRKELTVVDAEPPEESVSL